MCQRFYLALVHDKRLIITISFQTLALGVDLVLTVEGLSVAAVRIFILLFFFCLGTVNDISSRSFVYRRDCRLIFVDVFSWKSSCWTFNLNCWVVQNCIMESIANLASFGWRKSLLWWCYSGCLCGKWFVYNADLSQGLLCWYPGQVAMRWLRLHFSHDPKAFKIFGEEFIDSGWRFWCKENLWFFPSLVTGLIKYCIV